MTASAGRDTFGELLNSCAEVTQSQPDFVWVPDEALVELGVRQWSEMPLWRVHARVWNVDSSRAAAAGLLGPVRTGQRMRFKASRLLRA